MQSRLDEIYAANGEVFGISADSPFALNKWAEEEGYTFPLLSDYGKTVIFDYNVVVETLADLPNVPQRSAFLVDSAGKVVMKEIVETKGAIPDLDGFIDKLKSLA